MISLLVPTRGRPDWVKRFLDSALENAGGEFEAVFYVDSDDESLERYEAVLNDHDVPTKLIIGERIVLSAMWNRCSDLATGDILGHMGDDIVFRSPDWVPVVRKPFDESEDKILFVHGDDGYHNARFGTHGFIHCRWMEAVGYFVPPLYSSDWNDQHLNDLADALGRRIHLPTLYTEHLHYVFGKAPRDATYAEREERGARDNVMALYYSERCQAQRAEDVEKLRAVITGVAIENALYNRDCEESEAW